MDDPSGGWLSYFINQGVAIAVLVFVLVRLEARLARLESVLLQIAAREGLSIQIPPPGSILSKP